MSPESARNYRLESPLFKVRILSLKNATTQFQIPEGKIQFTQFLEDGIVLGIPKLFCLSGHQVQILIKTEGAPKDVRMEIIAKVATLEDTEKTIDRAFLKFVEYSSQDWQELRSQFEQHQSNVETLFKGMKSTQ